MGFKETLKKLYKSKTIIFALLLAVFGALQANLPVLEGIISAQAYGYFTIWVAVIVAFLRVLTTQSIASK